MAVTEAVSARDIRALPRGCVQGGRERGLSDAVGPVRFPSEETVSAFRPLSASTQKISAARAPLPAEKGTCCVAATLTSATLTSVILHCDNELPHPKWLPWSPRRRAVRFGGLPGAGIHQAASTVMPGLAVWRWLCLLQSVCPWPVLPLLLICWRRRRRETRPARDVGSGREMGSERGVSWGRCAEPRAPPPGTPMLPAASLRVRMSPRRR